MAKNDLAQPIRGARDFYPEDLAIRNWLFNQWRQVAKSFGYQEVDGPNIENFDLFAAKSGEELVNQQMYTLEDKDGRKLGVRPEITPSFARLVAKKQGQLTFPLRWMMFGEVWRYEKPQTGRSRDFWQWELNLVGGQEDLVDAEIIAIAAKALESIGLTAKDVVFRLNDRRFMQAELAALGIEGSLYSQTIKVIDRKEKVSGDEFDQLLSNLGLTTEQIAQLNSFLDNADYSASPKLTSLFKLLDKYGVSDFVKFDPLIVRGITYYTGVVFECFDRNQGLRSVFGGGRFDDLVETFGGGKIPAQGFAIGDVVVTELLKRLDKLPQLQVTPTNILVTIFSPTLQGPSLKLASQLRAARINTELYPDSTAKLDKQFKYADKKQIPFVAIIGERESQDDTVTLKNMRSGEQQTLKLPQLIQLLQNG